MSTKAQDAWNKIAVLAICDEVHKGDNYIDNVRVQKLCFLSELEGREQNLKTAYYRFFRYNHGPYSTALANDVAHMVKFGFIDPENGEMLDRGKYLYDYVAEEIEHSTPATQALSLMRLMVNKWRPFKGWDIVNEVYKLTVPVDGLGKEMLIKDIPAKTDILIPERSKALDVQPFSAGTVDDICRELSIPQERLVYSDEGFRSALASLDAALVRS